MPVDRAEIKEVPYPNYFDFEEEFNNVGYEGGVDFRNGKQPVAWAPVEVYDDASMTVIRFAEDLGYTAAPVLMAVTPDSTKTLPLEYVAYQVPEHPEKGLFYVTKGIYPRLRLLDGQHGRVDIVRLPSPAPAYVEQRHGSR